MDSRPRVMRYWVPDDECIRCTRCSVEFSPLIRRHHCRKCGQIFCDDCCSTKLLIPPQDMIFPPNPSLLTVLEQDRAEPQRVCQACSPTLIPLQMELQATITKASNANSTAISRDGVDRYFNSPISFSLQAEIKKAAYTLLNFTSENQIEGADVLPTELLWDCEGLAILTFIKAGFFFTGRFGTGLVIGRTPDRKWSAPSAICSTGVGWGFQIGGEVTDVIIILNTKSALEAFTSRAQVSLGTELSVSVGPLGRMAATDVRAGDGGMTAAFSYAHTKGLFVGVSLEAAVLVQRNDVNENFYGAKVSPEQLLLGRVPPPPAAEVLYKAIEEVLRMPAAGPGGAFGSGLASAGARESGELGEFGEFGDFAASENGGAKWACPRCTLENEAGASACIACENPRPRRGERMTKQMEDDRNLALLLQREEFERQARENEAQQGEAPQPNGEYTSTYSNSRSNDRLASLGFDGNYEPAPPPARNQFAEGMSKMFKNKPLIPPKPKDEWAEDRESRLKDSREGGTGMKELKDMKFTGASKNFSAYDDEEYDSDA